MDVKKEIPALKLPAVWLPYAILGISTSELVKIPEGVFGPFAGQVLVGDQGQSKIMRVFMEKVNGEFQGAAWDFPCWFPGRGFTNGMGEGWVPFCRRNRSWLGISGRGQYGIATFRSGITNCPFEMRTVKAMPDGFEIEFTKPVDKKSAENLSSYEVESFIYKYHPVYGSPPVSNKVCAIKGVKVSADGMKARIIVDGPAQKLYSSR
jgi:hypothetical protein